MTSLSPRQFNHPISSEIVEQYRLLDVACISDVTQGLQLNCVYQGLKPLIRTWKICGPAITIRLIPIQDRRNWYKEEQHPGSLMNIAEPGDVIVFHPSILHGGGPTRATETRRTLSLRFFGEDAEVAARPGAGASSKNVHPLNLVGRESDGSPFRHEGFPEIY